MCASTIKLSSAPVLCSVVIYAQAYLRKSRVIERELQDKVHTMRQEHMVPWFVATPPKPAPDGEQQQPH